MKARDGLADWRLFLVVRRRFPSMTTVGGAMPPFACCVMIDLEKFVDWKGD